MKKLYKCILSFLAISQSPLNNRVTLSTFSISLSKIVMACFHFKPVTTLSVGISMVHTLWHFTQPHC